MLSEKSNRTWQSVLKNWCQKTHLSTCHQTVLLKRIEFKAHRERKATGFYFLNLLLLCCLLYISQRFGEESPITQQPSLRPAFPWSRLPASPPRPKSSIFSWITTALPITDRPPNSVASDSNTALIFPCWGSKLPKSPGWPGWCTPWGL